ncbi:MAG: hypothetical protein ABI865_14755 [Nitrosospira sp.]
MENKKKQNSVKSLINLYTVVMGVALSLSITKLIDTQTGFHAVTASSSLLFISFIATFFCFYHGALRHIYDAHIENDNPHIKNGALIIDFLLLLLHGVGFVILSLLIQVPNHFAWALVTLLIVDVVWGLFAHFGSSSQEGQGAEWKWTIINLIFVLLAIWYLVANSIYFAIMQDPLSLSIPITIACVFRTLFDYMLCKDFYFPKQ